MHAIFPFSRVEEFNAQYYALIASHDEQMDACGVTQISVYSGISTNGFLFEPVLMWPDVVEEFHRRHTSDAVLANVDATEANEPARILVAKLRSEIVDLMYRCGGVHLQIGKAYPYMRIVTPPKLKFLRT